MQCKAFGVLPDKGGVLQQDPELMRAFGVIEGEVERAKAKAGGKATDSTRRHGEHGERQRRLENGDGDGDG